MPYDRMVVTKFCQGWCPGESTREVCRQGYFGRDCTSACACAGGEVCDAIAGYCPNMQCREGRTGIRCQQAVTTPSPLVETTEKDDIDETELLRRLLKDLEIC